MIIRFYSHTSLVNGTFVPVIREGVFVRRIDTNGGRESALLVATEAGPQVVRQRDVR